MQYLLSIQDASGSWTSARPVRSTAAGLMALACEEKSPQTDAAAFRAADWLCHAIDEAGTWVRPGTDEAFIEQGLATCAIASWEGRHPDPRHAEALANASKAIVRCQQGDGGWANTLGKTSKPTRLATALMIRAMASAGASGVGDRHTTNSMFQGASHLRRFQDRTGRLDGPEATWCAVNAWQSIGQARAEHTRHAVYAAMSTMEDWPASTPYPLLLALLAHQAAAEYNPWPAEMWAHDIQAQLADHRLPQGGWPASPVESAGGSAYSTAMALIQQSIRSHHSDETARRDPWSWTFPCPAGSWQLLAIVPMRDEDVLSMPEDRFASLASASRIWTLAEEESFLMDAREKLQARPPPSMRALLGLAAEPDMQRWSLEANWKAPAPPRALPPMNLLEYTAVADAIVRAVAKPSAPDTQDFLPCVQSVLVKSVQCWLRGDSQGISDLALQSLPPSWAAAWLEHRHEVVQMLAKSATVPSRFQDRAVVCLPAWYVLGDGGLLDELAQRHLRPLPDPYP